MAKMRSTVRRTIKAACRKWAPPPRLSIKEWARKYRYLSSIEAGRPGKYVLEVTPYLAWENGPLDALDDPSVKEIVCQKSAQVAWTSGVLGNALGKWIDLDPSPILVLFPKEGAAKEYMDEKFEPMVSATPRLRERIQLRHRAAGQRALFKRFPGGFLKLVGSNSPASVKSTPTPRVCVEEPDDCNLNLKGQGDSIKLAKERTKTYMRPKVILGGTPTIAGVSTIAAEMEISDKRVGMIPCHDCGDEHVLSFDNLHCDSDPENSHPVFGDKRPETAYYVCPHCGSIWDDAAKNRNVRRGRWQATAPFYGIAGFYLNELYSPFPGSRFAELMGKWLLAKHEAENGDIAPLISFVNSSQGLPFEMTSDGPDEGELKQRALPYEALTVPRHGLVLTMGVDVQHDRLAIILRAWGRGEESWLVMWGEIHGNPGDKTDPVWKELDHYAFGAYRHESGAALRVYAMSIDSSDGQTSDAVYHYVRTRKKRGTLVMAIKGRHEPEREIFNKPRPIDTNKHNTKADRMGVQVFLVGTSKAKDLLVGERGRISLGGSGAGRMHVYQSVRADYYDQLLSEVKAPSRADKNKLVWHKKAGRRNEALDCEVYALHAARAVKTHMLTEGQWADIERRVVQANLFGDADEAPTTLSDPPPDPAETAPSAPPVQDEAPEPAHPAESGVSHIQAQRRPPPKRRGGFATGWKR